MKLPFEHWLDEHAPAEEATVAFRESVVAFKAGAYRAALLFSWVGMGLCLRRQLLRAAKPDRIAIGKWDDLQRQLQNEHEWDAAVFDCTQMKPPRDIFGVDDHLRDEVKYWRQRRNDCAHFKRNEIGAPHVESFWLFLQSNLGRWVPNGSRSDVLDRLVRHFDANLTPPNADLTPIIRMIPQAVAHAELHAFFEEMQERLAHRIGTLSFPDTEKTPAVFDALLDSGNAPTVAAACRWLYQQPDVTVSLLRRSPRHCAILRGEPSLVRCLWRTMLFRNEHTDLAVFASLVRNRLIPKDEEAEAIASTVERVNGDIPTDIDAQTLETVGFWSAFARKAIEREGIGVAETGDCWRAG